MAVKVSAKKEIFCELLKCESKYIILMKLESVAIIRKVQRIKMKVLVCDDELTFLERISSYCKRFREECKIPVGIIGFSAGKDVIRYCSLHQDIDLFILDSKLKDMDGIRLTEELRKMGIHSKIVFLTSILSFAPKGYELGVSRYWMKPLEYSKFCSEMKMLYEDVKKESQAYFIERVGDTTEKMYFDDILYIATEGRKTSVHLRDSSYLSTTKMKEYLQKLDRRFFRCHAAYIVNMDRIKRIKGAVVHLDNGEMIYISKGRKSAFMDAFSEYLT